MGAHKVKISEGRYKQITNGSKNIDNMYLNYMTSDHVLWSAGKTVSYGFRNSPMDAH